MDPEIAYFLMEKTKKQEYLKIEVADRGYDTVEFAQFLDAKKCTFIYSLFNSCLTFSMVL